MFGPRTQEEFMVNPGRARRLGTARGAWLLLLLIGGGIAAFLVWASWFEIDEVTRGEGRVVPSRQIQVVQTLEPAIVRRIEVAEGDSVEAGQVLMLVDDTAAVAERGELLEREAALMAEEWRLHAEIALDRDPELPADLQQRAPAAVLAEMEVLQSRVLQLDGELAVLEDRLAQKKAALEELLADRAKQESIIAPLREEADLTEDLVFSEDGRVEAGRHCEEMAGCVGVVEASEVVGELLGGHVGGLGEEVPDVVVGAVELLGEGVDLDAVAGRQDHRLGDVLV